MTAKNVYKANGDTQNMKLHIIKNNKHLIFGSLPLMIIGDRSYAKMIKKITAYKKNTKNIALICVVNTGEYNNGNIFAYFHVTMKSIKAINASDIGNIYFNARIR